MRVGGGGGAQFLGNFRNIFDVKKGALLRVDDHYQLFTGYFCLVFVIYLFLEDVNINNEMAMAMKVAIRGLCVLSYQHESPKGMELNRNFII